MAGRGRPSNRYELLTCAWKGHYLVGVGAAHVAPEDALVVRECGGARWHRCLRCDAWVMQPIPEHPTDDGVGSRDQIEVPARGAVLRDRYVLRLIAVDRAIHVIVLTTLALVLFTFARHDQSLHRDYVNIMNDLAGGDPGSTQARGIFGYFGRAFKYSPAHLVTLGVLLLAYAALEATEMVGLWFNKRWAEYLTFVATTVLIPYELYELSLRVSIFKLVVLAINLAVAIYLLFAKRLFGLRGGHRAERARREALSGWPALEKATPQPVP
ncbi:MAG: DUF2127 domain-containing protein [Acidimicrobiales bacterium]